jgi:hypothetical protein
MDDKLRDVYRKLITANHILHHHGVVDAYGHISGTLAKARVDKYRVPFFSDDVQSGTRTIHLSTSCAATWHPLSSPLLPI